jgi:hypothetical protein
MLTLNNISISAKDSVLQELYSKLSPASVESDIRNYHAYASDGSRFSSLLFDGSYFGFDWAYIESCSLGSTLEIVAYSFNGNLATWAEAVRQSRSSDDDAISVILSMVKSVSFKSYYDGPEVEHPAQHIITDTSSEEKY